MLPHLLTIHAAPAGENRPPGARSISRRLDLLILLLLALLPLPLLGASVFGSRALVPAGQLDHFAAWRGVQTTETDIPPWDVLYWDDLAQLLPWQAAAHRSIRDGRVPLWNPDSACGAPLLANSQTSSLSPVWLLFQGMGLPRAQGWIALFQLFFAGAGAFAFFRFYQLRRLPALLGAVVYQLSGWSLCWTELPNRHAPVAYFPLVLWLFARSVRGGWIWRAAAAVVLAVSLLSGHLQFEFYLFVGLAIYAGWRGLDPGAEVERTARTKEKSDPDAQPGGNRLKKLGFSLALAGGISLLAVLLAAPQLLPTAELGRWSPRLVHPSWSGYSERMSFSMPAWWLAQVFLPGFFGYPAQGNVISFLRPAPVPVPFFSANFYETCVFFGTIPIVLLINGLREARRSPITRFFIVLAVVALLLAAGTLLNAPLYFLIPGFSGMAGTARMLFLFAFAAAGLAAVGVDALSRSVSGPWRAAAVSAIDSGMVVLLGMAFCAAAAFAIASYSTAAWYQDPGGMLLDRAGEAIAPAVLLIVGAILAGVIRARPTARRPGLAALIALTVGQLLYFGAHVIRTAPAKDVFPVSSPIRAIRALRPFRVMEVARGWTLTESPNRAAAPAPLPPNTAAYYGIASLGGYDSLNTRAYVDYVKRLQGSSPSPIENENLVLLSNPGSPLIGASGVDVVISSAPISAPDLRAIGSAGEVFLYRVRSARPRAFIGRGDPAHPVGRRPRVLDWRPGKITIDRAYGPGRLVVLNASIPGWSARVDGGTAPIRTDSELFQSIVLRAGVHHVTLEYRPLSFRFGVFLAALAALVLAMAGVIVRSSSAGRSALLPGRYLSRRNVLR